MLTSVEVGQSSSLKQANVYLLGEREFRHYWPQIETCLDANPELWAFSFTKEGLCRKILEGAVQAWVVQTDDIIHVVLMTQMFELVEGKVLQVFWAWGHDLAHSLPCLDLVLNRFARTFGCTQIDIQGRKGVERLLRPLGFEFAYTTVSRPVRAIREN